MEASAETNWSIAGSIRPDRAHRYCVPPKYDATGGPSPTSTEYEVHPSIASASSPFRDSPSPLPRNSPPFGVYGTPVSPGLSEQPSATRVPRSIPAERSAIYAKGMADFRPFHDDRNHTQAGDSAKLGQVIVELAEIEHGPVSFTASPSGTPND